MNPQIGQWTFRIVTTLAAPIIDLLLELQRQVDARQSIDWHPLISSLIAAVIIGLMHLSRAGTEEAERRAELRTGQDQDADDLAEGLPR